MLALQHDPKNKLSSMHRHPISLHLDQALANESHVEHAHESINNSDLDNQEAKHTETFNRTHRILLNEGYKPAIAALKTGNLVTVTRIFTDAEKVGKRFLEAEQAG